MIWRILGVEVHSAGNEMARSMKMDGFHFSTGSNYRLTLTPAMGCYPHEM
jgi:hypothetical protein